MPPQNGAIAPAIHQPVVQPAAPRQPNYGPWLTVQSSWFASTELVSGRIISANEVAERPPPGGCMRTLFRLLMILVLSIGGLVGLSALTGVVIGGNGGAETALLWAGITFIVLCILGFTVFKVVASILRKFLAIFSVVQGRPLFAGPSEFIRQFRVERTGSSRGEPVIDAIIVSQHHEVCGRCREGDEIEMTGLYENGFFRVFSYRAELNPGR